MANIVTVSGSVKSVWESGYFSEYVRASQFAKLMGKGINYPFQVNNKLGGTRGTKINFPLVTRLTQDAVTGDNVMEGAEEALNNYNHEITIDQRRNAVRVGKMEQQKTEVDYAEAAREMLKLWSVQDLRDQILEKLMSAKIDGTTAYASCSAAERNAMLVANSDRILYGAAKANAVSAVHATALALVDSTNDILQPAIVSLAKRMAKQADPHIRPMMVDELGEWYVMLAHSYCFRDLKNHATMTAAHSYAMERGKNNPLFSDGDLVWDGVIIKEIPEMDAITGVGASSIDVAPNFLLGAQAIGVAWGQKTQFVTKEFDYDNQVGVAISEIRGIEKMMHNSIQHGLVTVYAACVADT